MKIFPFLLVLFLATAAANSTVAQTQYWMIEGTVTYLDGDPVATAKISVKRKGSTDYSRIKTFFTDKDGRFSAHVEAGVYVVKTEYKCQSSRIEEFEVAANQTTPLNVQLPFEDCRQKEAQEEIEWKSCERETSVAGIQMSDFDKAEIINQILEELLKFEDGFIIDNNNGTIFSTENINAAWIKSFPNLNVSFLSPQNLQAKADSSKDGKVGYYAFSSLQAGNNCAFVGVSMEAMKSKNRPSDKEQGVYACYAGTQMMYLFRKDSGKWQIKQSRR